MDDQKRNKIIFFGLVGLFVVVVIWVTVLFILDIPKTGSVEIFVAPESARVKIGNETYRNGTHKIKPGQYDVLVEKEGFEGYAEKITVGEGEKVKIWTCLRETDGGDWYKDHASDDYNCRIIDESSYDRDGLPDPIYEILPYHSYDDGFNIDLSEKDEDTIIEIEPISCQPEKQEELKSAARKWLTDHGVNLEDYTVEYSVDC